MEAYCITAHLGQPHLDRKYKGRSQSELALAVNRTEEKQKQEAVDCRRRFRLAASFLFLCQDVKPLLRLCLRAS